MWLLTERKLRALQVQHPQAAPALATWRSIVRSARWRNPTELLDSYGKGARPISEDRVVFNICGGSFRLIVSIRWETPASKGMVFIKFFGTHAEYDKIDALTVDQT